MHSEGHSVHAVIIGWQGYCDRARAIATELQGHADRVTVVYSNTANAPETGSGDWLQVDNALFFGSKFAAGLARHDAEDFILIIQADALAADWPGVIRALRTCAGHRPMLGVWTPLIDTSFYHARCLTVAATPDPRYDHVCQTDAIVLAIQGSIVARLRGLDFGMNDLGWGIDKFANSVALSLGREIILDRSVSIRHAVGSGYGHPEAKAQMDAFLGQMTERERILHLLLDASFYAVNRQHRHSWLARILRRFRR